MFLSFNFSQGDNELGYCQWVVGSGYDGCWGVGQFATRSYLYLYHHLYLYILVLFWPVCQQVVYSSSFSCECSSLPGPVVVELLNTTIHCIKCHSLHCNQQHLIRYIVYSFEQFILKCKLFKTLYNISSIVILLCCWYCRELENEVEVDWSWIWLR